ncbi:MAG TPA: efflux RND transporter periplasmic adaptor subunit [Candidatus Angelobacter sp.]
MKSKARKIGLALGSLLVVGLGIALAAQRLRPAAKDIPTTRVQKGVLELDTTTDGEMKTPHSAMLVAPSVSGTLQIVHLAKAGTPVKAGEVIVEFDPSGQQYDLEQSRSKLAEAEQQIVKAQADAAVKNAEDKVALLKARFDVRRAELEVSKNELVSEIDAKKNLLSLEEARRRLAQLEQDIHSRAASNSAALAVLEEQRRTAQLGIKQAQHNIENMQLKSPIDGVVSVKENMSGGIFFWGMTLPEYREGDLVYQGAFLAEVLDTSQMEVVAKVFESDRSNVSVGQKAEVKIEAAPRSVFPASVKTIAGMASRRDFGPDSVSRFDVFLAINGRGEGVRPGSAAQILVHGSQLKDQLFVPTQCVFEKDGKLVAYVKQGQAFKAVDLKIKYRSENRVAVENLAEGTEVALVDPEQARAQEQKKADSVAPGVGQ